MFCSSEKTFDDAYKPLVFLNCHIGMGTFRLPNQSNTIYFSMQLWTLINSVVNWASIYVTFTLSAQSLKFRGASPMAVTMYAVILYTNSCITVIGPVLIWFQRKGLRDSVQKMRILEVTFQTILGARNEYRKEWNHSICHVIAVFFTVVMVSIHEFIWSLEYRSMATAFFFTLTELHPILVIIVLDLNFYTFVGYLRKKFRDLNHALLKLAEPSNSASYHDESLFRVSRSTQRKITQRNKIIDTGDEKVINDTNYLLQEIRKAHLDLCKLTRRINSIFGMQNLLSSGISFGMITGLLYTIYSAFLWKRVASSMLEEILRSVIWVAIYTFKIWMINHSCWSVTEEAKQTGEIIYELLKLKDYKRLQKNLIQAFALQMLQNPIRFDACGFFHLNYEFVQGMIGSITTYLIILIQMSQLSERTAVTKVFDPFTNGTGI